jgi:hypothetical protein
MPQPSYFVKDIFLAYYIDVLYYILVQSLFHRKGWTFL